jgi:hypothetical protein
VSLQSKQLALALRDEVIDLEKAGIKAVQVDDPAIYPCGFVTPSSSLGCLPYYCK